MRKETKELTERKNEDENLEDATKYVDMFIDSKVSQVTLKTS